MHYGCLKLDVPCPVSLYVPDEVRGLNVWKDDQLPRTCTDRRLTWEGYQMFFSEQLCGVSHSTTTVLCRTVDSWGSHDSRSWLQRDFFNWTLEAAKSLVIRGEKEWSDQTRGINATGLINIVANKCLIGMRSLSVSFLKK